MTKQLVVVVHGVGVREAGVSSVLLAASLDGDPPVGQHGQTAFRNRSAAERAEDELRPRAADDFLMRERAAFNRKGKASTFPARLSRYQTSDDTPKKDRRERVIADFYWGDITGTGGDILRVITGLFRLMLGLSHAVRENAWAIFPGMGWQDRVWRRAAGFAVLTVHGPIFALNLMLAGFAMVLGGLHSVGLWRAGSGSGAMVAGGFWLWFAASWVLAALMAWAVAARRPLASVVLAVGVVVALGVSVRLASDKQLLLQMCALTIAAGSALRLKAQAFLLRHLADWLCLCALGVLPFLAFDGLTTALLAVSSQTTALGTGAEASAFVRMAGVMVHGAILGWAAVVLVAGALLLRRAVRWAVGAATGIDFQAEAIGLMLILWLVVTGIFWGAGLKLASSAGITWGGNPQAVYQYLLFVPVAVAAFLVLAGLMLAQFAMTALRSRQHGAVAGYIGRRMAEAERNRLVVAAPAMWFLRLFVALAGATVLYVLTGGMQAADGVTGLTLATLQGGVAGALLALAGVGTAAIGFGRGALASGIGIAIDVLSYINSYSWQSGADVAPDGQGRGRNSRRLDRGMIREARTILEHLPIAALQKAPQRREAWGYWLRRRIQDRLRVLIAELIRDEEPDEILIVSHSQGTMIALDVVDLDGREWLVLGGSRLRALKLVTMGSPYLHVYHHYFPRGFPPPAERPVLGPVAQGGVLSGWTNIFRVDDFIGTHIDPDMRHARGEDCWPREVAVPPNGHTMYWIDVEVARELRVAAAFRAAGGGASKLS